MFKFSPETTYPTWNALMRRWTSLGMDPFSLSGAWLAGQRARLRMRPITAFTSGHRDGGCISRTMVGRPPYKNITV